MKGDSLVLNEAMARIRELELMAAKERSLAEQATRARNTAQAKVRVLERALDEAPSRSRLGELEADYRHENEGRRAIEALYADQKARAEKAETRVAELKKEPYCPACGSPSDVLHLSLCRFQGRVFYSVEAREREEG